MGWTLSGGLGLGGHRWVPFICFPAIPPPTSPELGGLPGFSPPSIVDVHSYLEPHSYLLSSPPRSVRDECGGHLHSEAQ